MTNAPLISIIMPCFNSANIITSSIDSVLAQTYTNFELIIIDDLSDDDILSVISSYNDERIIFIKNNYFKGVSGARQTGIDYSNGEFIAFLDSDDIWLPAKLEKQLSFMINENIVFSFSDYYIFHSPSNKYYEIISELKNKFSAPRVLSYEQLTYGCPIGCLTVMLKASIVKDIRFKNIYKEDYVYWLDILRTGIYAYNCGHSFACYRKSSGTLSSNKFKELGRQYYVIRYHENNSLVKTAKKMFYYIVNGFLKHLFHR